MTSDMLRPLHNPGIQYLHAASESAATDMALPDRSGSQVAKGQPPDRTSRQPACPSPVPMQGVHDASMFVGLPCRIACCGAACRRHVPCRRSRAWKACSRGCKGWPRWLVQPAALSAMAAAADPTASQPSMLARPARERMSCGCMHTWDLAPCKRMISTNRSGPLHKQTATLQGGLPVCNKVLPTCKVQSSGIPLLWRRK